MGIPHNTAILLTLQLHLIFTGQFNSPGRANGTCVHVSMCFIETGLLFGTLIQRDTIYVKCEGHAVIGQSSQSEKEKCC